MSRRKLNIPLVFITQSYFAVQQIIRLNTMHCFIRNISNKGELQQITFNHLSDIDFKEIFTKNVIQNHILF